MSIVHRNLGPGQSSSQLLRPHVWVDVFGVSAHPRRCCTVRRRQQCCWSLRLGGGTRWCGTGCALHRCHACVVAGLWFPCLHLLQWNHACGGCSGEFLGGEIARSCCEHGLCVVGFWGVFGIQRSPQKIHSHVSPRRGGRTNSNQCYGGAGVICNQDAFAPCCGAWLLNGGRVQEFWFAALWISS